MQSVLGLREAALSPQHLDFAGLMRARDPSLLTPDVVVLHEGQAFVYLIDYRHIESGAEVQLQHSMRLLALRSDAPYMAVVRPGVVQVYALSDVRDERSPVLETTDLDAGLLAQLVSGTLPRRGAKETSYSGHEVMLGLLNAVTDHLIYGRGISPDETLALVGRALFMRFLGDRGIIPSESPLTGVGRLEDCFATASAAASTSRWLDTTFNGDLLELPDDGSVDYFQRLDLDPHHSALMDLSAIMRGDHPVGDGAYQTQFRWGDLHFSYMPVGLLSQVYEQFAHRFDRQQAKGHSVYYTPRHLAEHMVDHALAILGPNAHQARVLDPASGGGVFLLATFRRLVKARWQATGKRPTTQVIREILNTQIVGFDINPAARQLSALALYLTAIELDPDSALLENLVFKPLQGSVLLAAEDWDATNAGCSLGSLSSAAVAQFEGQFDLVIGNPPWTAVSDAKRRKVLNTLVSDHMRARGVPPVANPDGVPDLPFVWTSTRFAKPDGVLAFALHGRLLTKLTPAGHAARTQLFRGIDVSYVVNGMELRNTEVWPNMSAHFCLLFAKNRMPTDSAQFHAVTPVEDRSLNREGRVRIDSKDAWSSDVAMVASMPHLFKTLAKGNALDVELIERIYALHYPSLSAYLQDQQVHSSDGYQTQQKGIVGVDAGFLRELPDMPLPKEARWYLVPSASLSRLEVETVHRRRERAIYRAPLVVLRESPSTIEGCPLAALALEDVAFRESYIGYSCNNAPDPNTLAVYLTALFNSPLFLYFILMTSGKFGCERSAFQKVEAEKFPIRPLQSMTPDQRGRLASIKQAILGGDDDLEEMIFAFVRDIYGLRAADVTLIQDRLALALPFAAVRNRAMAPPTAREVDLFAQTLRSGLKPFDMGQVPVEVEVFAQSGSAPWRFLKIGSPVSKSKRTSADLLASIALADMLDASRVELGQDGTTYVGLLNQRRFWSRTAARTLALDLIKRGDPVLSGSMQ